MVPITTLLQELFKLYDCDDSRFINFREYVISLSLVSQLPATERTIKLAFKIFDQNKDGLASKDELIQVLRAVSGNDVIGETFQTRSSKDGMTKEEFADFMKSKPEYTKVFAIYKL